MTKSLQGTIALMSLVQAFSFMLNSIPPDQIFTQLIISQLVTYFDKCLGWFKALTSRLSGPGQNTPSTKTAAAYAREGEIHEVATKLLKDGKDSAARGLLIDQEIQALICATRDEPLSPYDIISDSKTIASLSLLYNSMQWLSASLARLRRVEASSEPQSTSSPSDMPRWSVLASARSSHQRSHSTGGRSAPTFLPMTAESVVPFDKTLQEFQGLATVALLTLHIDIRCSVILQLGHSLGGPAANATDQTTLTSPRDSSNAPTPEAGPSRWVLQRPPNSASAAILELNNDLVSFDTNASGHLGDQERKFITRGLGRLIDRILVADANRIEVMNSYGAQRMGLDILVLQQNLRNISITVTSIPGSDSLCVDRASGADEEADALLQKSATFFNLFLQGPERVIEHIKATKSKGEPSDYSYDELKVLIELCYSEELRSGEREENLKAKKGLQDSLLWLDEAMWDS
jgi:exocyst complex component 4